LPLPPSFGVPIFIFWSGGTTPRLPRQPRATSGQSSFYVMTSDTSPGPFWPDNGDRQLINLFRAYPLSHRTFFRVPRNGALVFEVGLFVGSGLGGGGWVSSLFAGGLGFLACPFVELQVVVPGIIGPMA